MNLLSDCLKRKIHTDIITFTVEKKYTPAAQNIAVIQRELYDAIPDGKRISYGRVYTVKVLAGYLYDYFFDIDVPLFEIGSALYENSNDYRGKGVSLCLLSRYGLEDYEKVLPFFESAAVSDEWDVREMSQMFFRKLIKKYPDPMRNYLLQQVKSENAMIRRFVSETLRPVQENVWFYKQPEYSLSVIRNMFQEKSPYPRTSVGNNLSDLARRLPELVYGIVDDLVKRGDRNSFWIACRACRNLIKTEPVRVMDILNVDVYTYKKRTYKRSDFQ